MAIRTETGRVSFPHIFTPVDAFNTGKMSFEITLLFDKQETNLDEMRRVVKKCGEEKFGKLAFKSPIKDGDEINDEREAAGKSRYESHEGMWAVAFRSKNRPSVVDKNMQPIDDDGTLYAGCYARVSYSANPYKVTDRGVNLYLANVQMVREGEPFVSRSTPEEDFEPIAVDDDDDMFG